MVRPVGEPRAPRQQLRIAVLAFGRASVVGDMRVAVALPLPGLTIPEGREPGLRVARAVDSARRDCVTRVAASCRSRFIVVTA